MDEWMVDGQTNSQARQLNKVLMDVCTGIWLWMN